MDAMKRLKVLFGWFLVSYFFIRMLMILSQLGTRVTSFGSLIIAVVAAEILFILTGVSFIKNKRYASDLLFYSAVLLLISDMAGHFNVMARNLQNFPINWGLLPLSISSGLIIPIFLILFSRQLKSFDKK